MNYILISGSTFKGRRSPQSKEKENTKNKKKKGELQS